MKTPRVRLNSTIGSARDLSRHGLSAAGEARIRELELRVAQLEAEKRELRAACDRLGAANRRRAKLNDIAPVDLVTLDAQGTANGGIVTDLTERRRLEAEVLRISEREQRRIAQDLHDGLGQNLTGIIHLAIALQSKLADRAVPEAADAGRVVKLLDQAAIQTRTLARGLLPVPLEADGLMTALERLAAMVRDLFKIDSCFECPQSVFIPNNVVATHLYRIAQEAVNNAIKHGRASQIKIELVDASGLVTLTVRNNGLVISRPRSINDGIGLRIMRYRAKMIDGSLTFHSHAKGGTVVVCTIHRPAALPEPASSQ